MELRDMEWLSQDHTATQSESGESHPVFMGIKLVCMNSWGWKGCCLWKTGTRKPRRGQQVERGLAVSLEETWDQSWFSWSHVWSRTSSQCCSTELSWGQMFLFDPKLLGFTFSQPSDGSLYPSAAWSQSCRTISNVMDPNTHESFVSPKWEEMNIALVVRTLFFPWDFYSSFFLAPSLGWWTSGDEVLSATFVLLLYLCVLQIQPLHHNPKQAGLSMESKDSQRERWLEKGFSIFIVTFGLGMWKWATWYLVTAFQICHSLNTAYLVVSVCGIGHRNISKSWPLLLKGWHLVR